MFTVQTNDNLVACPYDKSHRMLRKRLQAHLVKCRTFHKDVELQKCPFNSTHLIPEPEFTYHVSNCEDRKILIGYKPILCSSTNLDRPKQKPIETDENWDDTDVNDYEPKRYMVTAQVLRKPEGITRSQRRAYVKEYCKSNIRGFKMEKVDTLLDDLKSSTISDKTSDDFMPCPPPPPFIKNWHRPTSSTINSNSVSLKRSRSPSDSCVTSYSSLKDCFVEQKFSPS